MYKIEIIGLGAGDIDQLPLGMYRKLKQHKQQVFTRTIGHPVVEALQEEQISFHAFDYIYEQHDQFQDVYEKIVEELVEAAKASSVLYTVPGHPMLAEQTVQLLLNHPEAQVEVLGGSSYLDDLFTTLEIDPIEGFQFIDATQFNREELSLDAHLVFCQVYNAFIASEVKLALLEILPADYQVWVVEAAGTKAEQKWQIPLEELDRNMDMSNLMSVYIPPVPTDLLLHEFRQLRKIIRTLRSPGGCLWDQKQTHDSLRRYLLEETYELLEAIAKEDDLAMTEELGDVLLQVLLHSQIGEEAGYFSMDDVIKTLSKKMIHRHPHVFDGEEPEKSWEELKAAEKNAPVSHSLLDKVVTGAPALHAAEALQKQAATIGFDWNDIEGVWGKYREEQQEFLEAAEEKNQTNMEEEFGDLLFVLTNVARHYAIDADLALLSANHKFIQRFQRMEQQVLKQNKALQEVSWQELDYLWEAAKEKERK